jgi:acyl carrier protein
MTRSTVSSELMDVVREAVADALGLDEEEVTPDATIVGDLGAESIDLLDILFRIERKSGIKVQAADLSDAIQGGIPDEEFGDENEIVTAVGLAHMKTVMPQIDTEALSGQLYAEQVMSLFTVENLAGVVAAKATTDAAAA